MLNAAEPPESVAEPICVAPSKKFTEPVGVPAVEETIADSVPFWLNVEGFGADVRPVAVAAWFTVCVAIEEVDVAKFADPA